MSEAMKNSEQSEKPEAPTRVAFSNVSIQLDALEIVDRVDEMLAWMAIAFEGGRLSYEQSHFLRAAPMVLIGKSEWGELAPTGVEVVVHHDDPMNFVVSDAKKRLPALLEEPRFRGIRISHLTEEADGSNIAQAARVVRCACGACAVKDGGDDIGDLVAEDGQVSGITYHLGSVGEMASQNSKAFAKVNRLPETARIFLFQDVLVFRDGRSTSRYSTVAFYNRRLFGMNGKPVNDDALFAKLYAAVARTQQRLTTWDVELSFGERRTGVALQTDAIGARAFVNMLRAERTSAGRRKTLIHWVNEHMRRRRGNGDSDVTVRGHLRGADRMDVGRYHARIWPAKQLIRVRP